MKASNDGTRNCGMSDGTQLHIQLKNSNYRVNYTEGEKIELSGSKASP